MNLQRVNTLIESTTNTFQTMLSLHVDAMAPVSKLSNNETQSSVTAIIGLTGDLIGSITLATSLACAKRLASVFTGADVNDNADEMCDVIGELASMIAESAISQNEEDDITCLCPSVVIGVHQTVEGRASDDRFVIPFSCKCGEFSIAMSVHCGDEMVESSQQSSSNSAMLDGAAL